MKMRVLTTGKKAKLLSLANIVNMTGESAYRIDTIYSPAYSCENERIIVIAGPLKEKMSDVFDRTINSYKRSVTSNVAFMIQGTPENSAAAFEKYKKILKEAGTNVIDDVCYVSVPFFGSKVTAEEKEKVTNWTKSILAKLA